MRLRIRHCMCQLVQHPCLCTRRGSREGSSRGCSKATFLKHFLFILSDTSTLIQGLHRVWSGHETVSSLPVFVTRNWNQNSSCDSWHCRPHLYMITRNYFLTRSSSLMGAMRSSCTIWRKSWQLRRPFTRSKLFLKRARQNVEFSCLVK